MSVFIIIALIVLVFVIIYQIGKASEYALVLRGEEKVKAQANRAISVLLLVMFALGVWGIWECNELFKDSMLPVAACKTGENYDMMFKVTVAVTGTVFFLTQFITVYSFIIGGCLSVAFVLVKIISQGDPALIQPGTLGMTCHIDQHPVFGIGVVKP